MGSDVPEVCRQLFLGTGSSHSNTDKTTLPLTSLRICQFASILPTCLSLRPSMSVSASACVSLSLIFILFLYEQVTFADTEAGFEKLEMQVRDWNGTTRVSHALSPSEFRILNVATLSAGI